ncbi:hypothetical protein [Bacteroides sp. 214]|uniref:hypothetical protein n=1 Tax=Bacteroides sp. 214 TaxID=2302935 RepID=UPI0013D10260|nr:hypothetical protein [Bacteroides sp. 214]
MSTECPDEANLQRFMSSKYYDGREMWIIALYNAIKRKGGHKTTAPNLLKQLLT